MTARVLELSLASDGLFRSMRAERERLAASHNVLLVVGSQRALLVRKGGSLGMFAHPLVILSRTPGRDREVQLTSAPSPAPLPVLGLIAGFLFLAGLAPTPPAGRATPMVLTWCAAHPAHLLGVALLVALTHSLYQWRKYGGIDVAWSAVLVDQVAQRSPMGTVDRYRDI